MAKKKSKPTFILELPLVVQPQESRVMGGRFESGRRLFNAVLGDGLKSLDLMRESKRYAAARDMPKLIRGEKNTAKTEAFKVCSKHFGFSEYAMQALAIKHKNAANFDDRLGSHETQKLGTRVFKALQEYAFGKRGRPRFKGKFRPLHSLEGKNNLTGIRWDAGTGCVTYGKLVLPAIVPTKYSDPYVHAALASKTKYCRMVWRMEKGHKRWFVQLIQEGLTPEKYVFSAKDKTVGLDIGPSTIAIIADDAVALEQFAPSVIQPWKQMRLLQRAQDRSLRATNPDNYQENGVAKKGARRWSKSRRYTERQIRLSELERCLNAARKRDHGELVNKILVLGATVNTETLSYKSFQKNFGRSTKVRAAGAFVTQLIRKAERAGGKVNELNTRMLKMSQYDHITGGCTKKKLSLRWHTLGSSSVLVQRDCYSAFLAKNASGSQHNSPQLHKSWVAAEPLLRRVGLCVDQSASVPRRGVPTVPLPSELIARRRRLVRGHARDVVGQPVMVGRELGNPAYACL